MEIPQNARKCPYCQHFQARSALVFHPAFGAVLAIVPMLVLYILFLQVFDRSENYEEYKNQIIITDSQTVFGESKGGGTVGVIGTMKNSSSIPWKEIRFHVEFFDSGGKRVEQYDFHLPPREALSFKVSFAREYPQTNYVKHSVRIATAKDARARW